MTPRQTKSRLEILSDLESFDILVRLTASWCDFCLLGGDIFLYISLYSCMSIFIFTHIFTTSRIWIKVLAAKNYWIRLLFSWFEKIFSM